MGWYDEVNILFKLKLQVFVKQEILHTRFNFLINLRANIGHLLIHLARKIITLFWSIVNPQLFEARTRDVTTCHVQLLARSCRGSIWEVVTQLSHFWAVPFQIDLVFSRISCVKMVFTRISCQNGVFISANRFSTAV